MNRILVIAPHPDDEVLGCGAQIKKYSEYQGILQNEFYPKVTFKD